MSDEDVMNQDEEEVVTEAPAEGGEEAAEGEGEVTEAPAEGGEEEAEEDAEEM